MGRGSIYIKSNARDYMWVEHHSNFSRSWFDELKGQISPWQSHLKKSSLKGFWEQLENRVVGVFFLFFFFFWEAAHFRPFFCFRQGTSHLVSTATKLGLLLALQSSRSRKKKFDTCHLLSKTPFLLWRCKVVKSNFENENLCRCGWPILILMA